MDSENDLEKWTSCIISLFLTPFDNKNMRLCHLQNVELFPHPVSPEIENSNKKELSQWSRLGGGNLPFKVLQMGRTRIFNPGLF